jgi:hypothetical protein
MKLSAKVPPDDKGAKLVRFKDVRGQRYTEIFLIGGHVLTRHLVGGVYNTLGRNDPAGTGDTSPQDILDKVDVDALEEEYDLIRAFKNGPRLWCLDWVEVMVGKERDFHGLHARWVMWLDVPKEMRKHQSVAYKEISGKRDTQLGITAGSPAFLLKDLGGRLNPAPGWKFRAVVLDQDLVLTPDDGAAKITQDELGNTYDRVGGAYSNYKP